MAGARTLLLAAALLAALASAGAAGTAPPDTAGAPATAEPDTAEAPVVGVSLWPPELTTLGAVWSPQVRINDRIGVGLGLETLLPYRLGREAEGPVSSYSLYVMGTTRGQWRVNTANDLYWSGGRHYARVRLDHDNLARQFFGTGPRTSGSDPEVYRPQSTLVYAEGTRAFGDHLAIGPRVEAHHQAIHEADAGGQLARGAVLGAGEGWIAGAGLIASYDRRDCRLRPCRGLFGQLMAMAFVDDPGEHRFQLLNVDLRTYVALARGQILAAQVFYYGVRGDPPFWRLASLGGRDHSRAYNRDRWLDKALLAAQVEWRWRFSRRLGLATFAGTAVIDRTLWDLRASNLRPTLGLGLRVYPGLERSVVPVRLDLAVGHRKWRAVLAVGEAF